MQSRHSLQSILKYSLIAASIALASCGGGGGSDSTAPTPTPNPVDEPVASGLLVPVETQEQLVNSFRQGFTQTIAATDLVAVDDGAVQAPLAEASGDSASSRSFTTTYTLERGIDEHDAVKYDGSHLFIAPSRSMDCCFIVDDFVLEDDVMIANDAIMIPEDGAMESEEHSIRILATDPEQAGATQVGSIAVDSNRSIEGLYIDNSQLVSINSSGWWGLYGDAFISPRTWQGQSTGLEV